MIPNYISFCNMNIVYTFPNFSFTEGGNYNYPGNNKVAKNPYIRLEGGFSFCELQCDNETSCNGYSIDESTNSCFLSRCNEYIIVTCSSCFFAKKKSEIISCPPVTSLTTTKPLTCVTTTNESTSTVTESTTGTKHFTKEITSGIPQLGESSEYTIYRTTQSQPTATSDSATKAQPTATSERPTKSHPTATAERTAVAQPTTTSERTAVEQPTSPTAISISEDNALNITVLGTLCTCVCKHATPELKESMEVRRKELDVSKLGLSSEVRKRTSASDSRTSSYITGALAITIMLAVFMLFLCSDIYSNLSKRHPKHSREDPS